MILSTNQKLVSLGQDYSAGENIGIYEHTISSRNWSPDITYAAESAFQRATGYTEAQISALSGDVSSEVSQLGSDIQYISGVALTSHQSLEGYLTKASGDEYYQPIGSYATVSQLESTSGEIVNLIPTDYVDNETLEQTSGNIVNLIPDTSEFITNTSAEQTYQPIGNYLSSNALEGYATQDWVNEQGYLTGVSIPESATWQDVSTTVQTNSAQWGEGGGGGDEEVNSFVYNNSATINEVNTSYQTNSGTFLTAAPANMATTGDIAELAQTVSETYQTKGDYLVRSDSANFYPANNPSSFTTEDWVTAQGYITGTDLSNYYTKDETSGKEELANAFANIPAGDTEVNAYVHNNSASIDESTNVLQSNSSVWNDIAVYQSNSANYLTAHQDISNKLDTTAFSTVSGDFLTTSFGISESAHWEEATQAYEQNSGTYLTGYEFPVSADEAVQYVENNSATINDVSTTYQNNSATYLTAHQAISANEWNSNYETVNTNSGAWGGSALPISAGPGIKFEMVDNTLVASIDETELLASTATSAFTLTEPFSSFEQVKIKLRWWDKVPDNYYNVERFTNNKCSLSWTYFDNISDASPLELAGASWTSNNGIDYNLEAGFARVFGTASSGMANFTHEAYPLSIVGINRIAGGN